LIAAGHADGTIALWQDTQLRATLSGHTWTVYDLAFTPDGRTLISGSADGTVRQWDVAAGRERRSYRWQTSWVTCVAVAPDGMTAAAGSADHTVVVWDVDDD
jgi:WD40 repeat protein